MKRIALLFALVLTVAAAAVANTSSSPAEPDSTSAVSVSRTPTVWTLHPASPDARGPDSRMDCVQHIDFGTRRSLSCSTYRQSFSMLDGLRSGQEKDASRSQTD